MTTETRSRSLLRRRRAGTLAAALVLLPAPAEAHLAGDTIVVATITDGRASITPGLCSPAPVPACNDAYVVQNHLTSRKCHAAGRFEGRALRPGSNCGIDITVFMEPTLDGLGKPNCLTTHTYTSDAATAFGPPVNAAQILGTTRKIHLSYPAAVLASRTATGWLDDDDADTDPVGDHTATLSIQVRPESFRPSRDIPCVNAPVTRVQFTGVLAIH